MKPKGLIANWQRSTQINYVSGEYYWVIFYTTMSKASDLQGLCLDYVQNYILKVYFKCLRKWPKIYYNYTNILTYATQFIFGYYFPGTCDSLCPQWAYLNTDVNIVNSHIWYDQRYEINCLIRLALVVKEKKKFNHRNVEKNPHNILLVINSQLRFMTAKTYFTI